MIEISVVSPVYRSAPIVKSFVERLTVALQSLAVRYEIILIDDGSTDDSWTEIITQCNADKNVKGIKLSKNFGQHHAITAGLDRANGQWIVVMDSDLQDQPEEIHRLYNKAKEGYDIVFARRANRADAFRKSFSSVVFYKLFSYLSGIKQDGTIANFGIYSRKTVNAINRLREPMRAFSPMARWVGFKKATIDVQHNARTEGKSTYTWSKLINLALDISIAYSDKPLKMAVKLGLFISFMAFLFTIYNLVAYFSGEIKVVGYASLIISIWFLSGLIILILGVVGLYVGKTFEGIKNRPLYIEDEILNF